MHDIHLLPRYFVATLPFPDSDHMHHCWHRTVKTRPYTTDHATGLNHSQNHPRSSSTSAESVTQARQLRLPTQPELNSTELLDYDYWSTVVKMVAPSDGSQTA